jgi:acyl carrier protein
MIADVNELRELILRSAPDEMKAQPVLSCGEDERLDSLMPFSSIIVLGVIVSIEDRYGIKITKEAFENLAKDGVTLAKITEMVNALQRVRPNNEN